MEHWQRMQTLASVTSYAEVWIEILHKINDPLKHLVTSYAEVWIEIDHTCRIRRKCRSHLLRGGVD